MPSSQKYTKFWEKGFEILQNIEDSPVATNKVVEAMGRHNAPQLCFAGVGQMW
jgi:hypothetical protein